jgi:hypothetical protein
MGISVIGKLFESQNQVIKIFAESGYQGKLINKVKAQFKIELEIINKLDCTRLRYYPKDGWLKEHLHGSTMTEVKQKL